MLLKLTSILIFIDVSTSQMQFPVEAPSNNYDKTQISQYTVEPSINKEIFKLSVALATQIQNGKEDVYACSPVNIAATLSMVLLGTRGRSFDELANFLGLNSNAMFLNRSHLYHEKMGMLLQTLVGSSGLNLGYELNLASAIFVQDGYPIRPIYKEISQRIYRSQPYNVNFKNGVAAKDTINDWVKLNTNSKISKILENKPDVRTKVVIAGVLYFKAAWKKPFREDGTAKKPFYTNGDKSGSTAMVDMMINGGEFPYYYDSNLDCEILGLPYKGNKATMFIVRPKNSSKDKLKQLQSKLTPDGLEGLIKNTTDRKCAIAFPRMRLETSYNFENPLRVLGVKTLFVPNQANFALLTPGVKRSAPSRADFESKLNSGESLDYLRASLPDSENPGIYATDVFHKVCIDITEKGTEAAAATSTSTVRGGNLVIFRTDTPFLFYIWNHDAQVVLFWGAVNTPTPSYK